MDMKQDWVFKTWILTYLTVAAIFVNKLLIVAAQLKDGIDGVNYNMAMNTNNLQNTMCNNTRDIIESQNCGTRAILDAITNNRIEDKNQQIQAQQNEINALRLAASQQAQNAYLIDQLRTKMSTAFISCMQSERSIELFCKFRIRMQHRMQLW